MVPAPCKKAVAACLLLALLATGVAAARRADLGKTAQGQHRQEALQAGGKVALQSVSDSIKDGLSRLSRADRRDVVKVLGLPAEVALEATPGPAGDASQVCPATFSSASQ